MAIAPFGRPSPYHGLGATFKIVEDLIRSDVEATLAWAKETRRGPGGSNNPSGSNQHGKREVNPDIVRVDQIGASKKQYGNGAADGLLRLQRAADGGNGEAAAQLAEVKVGRKKVHTACVAVELVMIDENLCRTDLTPAQAAWNTQRRKDLYETLHPETVNGANQHTRVRQIGEPTSDRFTAETAERRRQLSKMLKVAAMAAQAAAIAFHCPCRRMTLWRSSIYVNE